ncbi:MAG TPA: dihydrofolate reductase family protein [Actinomycetes bacterium]|nr:dihydrofolate reductase family protein [Actinomycetes bacterium]
MRKLYSFMVVSLDGFYEGPNGEFDWPVVDQEFNEFSIEQLHDTDALLFGRVTYEGMAAYWPTPAAREDDPVVAELMNSLPKMVVSTTLTAADWGDTRLVVGNVAEEIAKLKQEPGKSLAIMGSPNLTVSLLGMGLVDELRVMVHPILLGGGRSLFRTLGDRLPLQLLQTRTFSSGNVLLTYRPA